MVKKTKKTKTKFNLKLLRLGLVGILVVVGVIAVRMTRQNKANVSYSFQTITPIKFNGDLPPTDPAYIQAYGKWGIVRVGDLAMEFPIESYYEIWNGKTRDELLTINDLNKPEAPSLEYKGFFGRQVAYEIKGQPIIAGYLTSPYLSKRMIQTSRDFLTKLNVDSLYLNGNITISKLILPNKYQNLSIEDLMVEINRRYGMGNKANCLALGKGYEWDRGSAQKFILDDGITIGYRFLSDMCYPPDGGAGPDPEYFFKLNNQMYRVGPDQGGLPDSVLMKIIKSIKVQTN